MKSTLESSLCGVHVATIWFQSNASRYKKYQKVELEVPKIPRAYRVMRDIPRGNRVTHNIKRVILIIRIVMRVTHKVMKVTPVVRRGTPRVKRVIHLSQESGKLPPVLG